MKNFEDKFNPFDCDLGVNCAGMACDECKTIAEYWYREALEWMKAKLGCEIQPGDVEYFIDNELKDEDEELKE
jgi:hypothetical protein